MKTRKILFTTSGVLKIVISGLTFLLFLLIMLLGRTIITKWILTEETFEQFVNEMVAVEPDATFLQEMNLAELQEYFLSALNTFCGIILFFCSTGIVFGVFNLIFAKKYDTLLKNRLGRKISFMIFSLILYPGLITNVLTIVALFLKDTVVDDKQGQNDATTLQEGTL